MALTPIHAEAAPAAVGPYSQAILAGGFLYISGQLPMDAATKELITDDIKAATKKVLENAGAILKEAGLGYEDVVKTTVYLQDIGDFGAMNEVYGTFFTDHKPARAAFEVAKLPLGATVEIEMVAYKG